MLIDDTDIKFNISFGDGSDCGGGIYLSGNHINVLNTNIYNNYSASNGGGIYISGSNCFIYSCKIYNNEAAKSIRSYSSGGGGIFTNSLTNIIQNCEIYNNITRGNGNAGGGIYGGTIKNSRIYNNSANWGGGLKNSNAINCYITNNIATGHSNAGGGVYNTTLINCLIYGNTSNLGGGIFSDSYTNIINCNIIKNNAGKGGGVYGTPNIKNSIIWYNISSIDADQIYVPNGTINLSYCSYSNLIGDLFGTINKVNCQHLVPNFVNINENDFRLFETSPCLDSGNNSYNNELFDIRGVYYKRKIKKGNASDGIIDIGAYEFNNKLDTTLYSKLFIPLSIGWNLISTHIQPQLPDTMNNVMDEIKSNHLIAKNNGGQVFIPSYDINTIGRWNVTQGYLVYMSAADILSISGSEVVPGETPISLNAGWNMIAYLRNAEMSAELSFASITDNNNLLIAKTLDGKVFIPSYNINTLGSLKPGVGYKVYVITSDTLVYPNN